MMPGLIALLATVFAVTVTVVESRLAEMDFSKKRLERLDWCAGVPATSSGALPVPVLERETP